jgi:two-component system LytT family sensor kinase
MVSDHARRHGLWKALLICGLWAAFAAFYSAQSYYFRIAVGRPESLGSLLPRELFYVALWGLATPWILSIARRLPVDRRNWHVRIPAHVGLAFVFAIAQRSIYDATRMGLRARGEGVFDGSALGQSVIGSFDYGMFLYFIVLLIGLALGYYERFQREQEGTSRLRADLAAARLSTLQMQLQPHFLFNTLNAIAVLIRTDPDAAGKMVGRLGDFLRATLENRDVRLIPLRRELELLDTYLEIEGVRFGDRLRIEREVDPRVLDATVPFLILQPLVENAIRHGIGENPGPGMIGIGARPDGGFLVLEVRDNGDAAPKRRGSEAGHGLGLANTRARLRELYGDRQDAQLTTDAGGGAVATLRLPLQSLSAPPPAGEPR